MKRNLLYIALLLVAAQGAWAYKPTTMNPAPSEGPWTFDTVNNQVADWWITDASLRGLGGSAWPARDHDGHDRTYQWSDKDGLGFTICATSTSKTHYGVFSSYHHNELVPAYTRRRMTWAYTLGGKSTDLKQCVALYALDGLRKMEDKIVDFTSLHNSGKGNECCLHYMLLDPSTETHSAVQTATFDFDNRDGDSEQTKQWAILLTIVAENSSDESDAIHQWGSFRDENNTTWQDYYYKHFTFAPNGGVGTMNVQEIEGSGNLSANKYTRNGYIFQGWATTPNGAVAYNDGHAITTKVDDKGAFTLYAVWKPTVATVIALINAIGDVVYTTECKARIDDARAAYTKLSSAEQSQVGNYGTLTAAETTYDKVGVVIAKIAAIGDVVYTTECKALIDEAQTAFDALTEAQQAIVINASVLHAAQALYAVLEVDAEIAAIGVVAHTAQSKALIDAARNAYDALSAAQKTHVSDYATLLAAEQTYADLGKTTVLYINGETSETISSEQKAITYPDLPGGATNWQTVEQTISEPKTIVIKAQ